MPTLYETLQSLAALQALDTQIARARRAEAALDSGAAAAQTAASARAEADARTNTLHKLQADLKDSELKLKSVEDKRKSYHDRLYQGSITNPKELSNIEKEIGALGRQRSDLDERILELMDQVETAQTAQAAAEAAAHESDTRRADAVANTQARRDALQLDLAQLSRSRTETAALIEDKMLLKRYEDIRAKAGVGIARIVDGACGACHMSLPSAQITAVKDYAAPQVCENCGRLLLI